MIFHVRRHPVLACILVALLFLMPSVSSVAIAQANIEIAKAEVALVLTEQSGSSASKQVNTSSEIPFKKEPPASPENLANIAAGFGLVLLVFAALLFYFKLQGKGTTGPGFWKRKDYLNVGENKLLVKKRISLTAKNSLHVVEWNGTEYLIACTDRSTSLIATNSNNERCATKDLSSE